MYYTSTVRIKSQLGWAGLVCRTYQYTHRQ